MSEETVGANTCDDLSCDSTSSSDSDTSAESFYYHVEEVASADGSVPPLAARVPKVTCEPFTFLDGVPTIAPPAFIELRPEDASVAEIE